MTRETDERISQRAYQIWEAEGRPHGRHDEHWAVAMQELGLEASGSEAHPGMLGDGTEEQNLNQPGNSKARISEAEVTAAFGKKAAE